MKLRGKTATQARMKTAISDTTVVDFYWAGALRAFRRATGFQPSPARYAGSHRSHARFLRAARRPSSCLHSSKPSMFSTQRVHQRVRACVRAVRCSLRNRARILRASCCPCFARLHACIRGPTRGAHCGARTGVRQLLFALGVVQQRKEADS